MIKFMILLGIFSILNFLFFFFRPEHRVNSILFGMLTMVILYGVLKKLYMWYNYSNISVPKPPPGTPDLTVDILTTYFPGEPYSMITTTLKAIKNIRYPHTTYLCDEADDPYLRKFCEENGIRHVTRDNRKDAKAGNINNTLRKYATGDICVILDPDHIPEPHFLDPILPHFSNPEIGFVQVVQSYYNVKESLVAQGAAEQTFQFYGPMMMTLNSYGAVNAIGANCVFRRTALDSIGGHAPGLCEDMHTAMLLYSKKWKSVYVPQVVAKGLAPSNLTNFFKQQLKWSRGTFDLWVKVYPRIFRKLTTRQKIHYGILPMHYLSGLIILFTFLIPILSLLFSTTPWKGNIIDFLLVILPVAASAVLIRTFIQKWVIEKKERGFHIVGGLLHINTWWIYILGLVYTILDRKVPYLPTPKEDAFDTHMKIIVPNAIVAAVSIFAIIYGLNQDFTPFSIIMAGFALFNASIMLFGIYVAVRVTNQNRILRQHLHKSYVSGLSKAKKKFYRVANMAFLVTRKIALPALLLILITAMSFKNENDQSKWEDVYVPVSEKEINFYTGIFHPSSEGGLTNLEEVTKIERQNDFNFDIISLYLAWDDESLTQFPHGLLKAIYNKEAIPMITWEPWASTLAENDSNAELQAEKKVFRSIINGNFDKYITSFAQILKSYDKPIFLRFAHEFDNPQYPWSAAGDNTPEEFKAAWIHVHDLFRKQGADKTILVWNPWKPESMAAYYPGDRYVDWVGITLLDYSPLKNVTEYSFSELYQPFGERLNGFTRKPVMLSEFGSLQKGKEKQQWLHSAVDSIQSNHSEISGLIFFNSSLDKNIPVNTSDDPEKLDWTIDSWDFIKSISKSNRTAVEPRQTSSDRVKNQMKNHIKGVRYKKGTNWKNNYYAVTKEVLEKDLEKIASAGMNTIHITGGNIYDHNLLKYSEEHGMQVIYQFNIDQSINFIEDTSKLDDLKSDIIGKVEEIKDRKNVVAYSFNMNLQEHYLKPELFNQETAYLNWLQRISAEIRRIDPETPLTLDLPLEAGTPFKISSLNEKLPVDYYGIKVTDTTHLRELLHMTGKTNPSVYISSIDPKVLVRHPEMFSDMNVVLENWQDERHSNWMTFDGLTDFRGRKKETLKEVTALWTKKVPEMGNAFQSRILKPAEPLYPGQIYTYHASIHDGTNWNLGTYWKDDYSFEWNLIKTDVYGNPLALKRLGSGPEIDIIIPSHYKHHQVMLTVRNKESQYVRTTRTSLHTLRITEE